MITGEPDDRETVMSGSAGGRAEQDLLRQTPRRAADPTGWCMNARRNARDYERLPQHSEAHLNWALITMMTRRLTRKSPRTDSWERKS